MDIATIVGLAAGLGALLIGFTIEGGSLAALLNVPASFIVFGGTLGATLVSFHLGQVLALPRLIRLALVGRKADIATLIRLFVDLAGRARREGLLSLEEEVLRLEDPFLKRGMLLVVDGTDPEVIREVLKTGISALAARHRRGYSMLEAMGGYAPTMGIIGTVMGLISVLGSLEDPSELGPAIAVAFVATLYGVASANLIWLPLAAKLKEKSQAEVRAREIMLEGVLSIMAGDNPRIVQEKLEAFLPTKAQEQAGEPEPQVEPAAEAEAA